MLYLSEKSGKWSGSSKSYCQVTDYRGTFFIEKSGKWSVVPLTIEIMKKIQHI